MALRTYSVVVQPNMWDNPLEDLARLLAPVTGASTRDVLALLRKGPMTVESDLSEAAARRLETKLRGKGIIPIVRGDDGSTLDDPVAGISAMLDAMGVAEIEVDDFENPSRGLSTAQGIPAAPKPVPKPAPQEAATRPVPVHDGRTLMGVGSSGVTLPQEVQDVIAEAALGREPNPKQASYKPDDISSDDPFAVDLGPSLLDQNLDVPDDLGDRSGSVSAGWESLFPGISGEADVLPDSDRLAHPVATTEALPGASTDMGPGVFSPEEVDTARTVLDADIPDAVLAIQATLERRQPTQVKQAAPEAIKAPKLDAGTSPVSPRSDFEVAKVSRAMLSADDGKPPYAPKGYDDRPDHAPEFAAFLSAIAPGAGQIYNGDDDDALSYGLRCFMVTPWIESVREARERAEKIASYWAPRPPDGAIYRSLRYLAIWWLCVGSVLAILATMTSFVIELMDREPIPEVTEVDVRRCYDDALIKVQEARIASLDAVAAARLEQRKQFTMSDDERAERLFLVGYEYCRQKSYQDCENAMRKVNSLKPGHRKALRLQSWASTNRRGNKIKNSEMPDVGVVESLGDFELRKSGIKHDSPAAPVEVSKDMDTSDAPDSSGQETP